MTRLSAQQFLRLQNQPAGSPHPFPSARRGQYRMPAHRDTVRGTTCLSGRPSTSLHLHTTMICIVLILTESACWLSCPSHQWLENRWRTQATMIGVPLNQQDDQRCQRQQRPEFTLTDFLNLRLRNDGTAKGNRLSRGDIAFSCVKNVDGKRCG